MTQITPRYVLFYSIRSPFARRVRVAMQRLGAAFEAQEISVFEPTEEFLKANPLGLVPALMVEQGKEKFTICDSATILEYLNDEWGGRIWPTDPQTRVRVRAASTLAEGLMTMTVNYYLETGVRKSPDLSWAEDYKEAILRTAAQIAEQPLDRLPFKISDLQITQAGYDLLIALEYMEVRIPQLGIAEKFPSLKKFLEHHRKRQDLASTAPPA